MWRDQVDKTLKDKEEEEKLLKFEYETKIQELEMHKQDLEEKVKKLEIEKEGNLKVIEQLGLQVQKDADMQNDARIREAKLTQ